MQRQRTVSIAPHHVPTMPYSEAVSRCFAAARTALKGDRWGYAVQLDCAADVLGNVLAETLTNPRRGLPADVLAWIAFVERCPTSARRYAEGVDRSVMAMGRLVGMAANWRRGYLREVARLKEVGAANVRLTEGSAGPMAERDAASPDAARTTAVEMLSALGLPRVGKLYPVAYAAAREADGLSGEEIATELGVKPATLRKQLSRAAYTARDSLTHGRAPQCDVEVIGRTGATTIMPIGGGQRMPSPAVYSAREHAEVLRVDEYRPAGKRGQILAWQTGDDANAWRTAQTDAPVVTRRTTPTREPWNGVTCAWWAEGLPATTAARLAHNAERQRERAAELPA